MVLICVLLCILLSYVISFNLDTKNIFQYGGYEESMFGFSVAGHHSLEQNWILVGAPKFHTGLVDVVKDGAVFKCGVKQFDNCTRIPFDIEAINNREYYVNQSDQWFGATVNTDGPESPIVVCAPRFVMYNLESNEKHPVGACSTADSDFTNFRTYTPCVNSDSNLKIYESGSCQAGFSAAISKKDDKVFIGAPGSQSWKGQVFQRHLNIDEDNDINTQNELYFKEDSYLGYSMTLLNIDSNGKNGVAVGIPHGANSKGKVILYSSNLTDIKDITGEQLGAYFGYAIISTDLDGDNFDDLIIGAPLYTTPNKDGKYEVGRVYVVYQGNEETRLLQGKFRRIQKLDGMSSRSRFGTSLAALGDINLDGYKDFAVGAPYDGPHQRGAIYIFHGNNEGASNKHTQVIYAEDISKSPVYTFGFSLSGGMDMDENNYPDLIVGAYSSNAAFVIKSKAIIEIESMIKFDSVGKQIRCTGSFCKLEVCMKYNTTLDEDELVFDIKLSLDTKTSLNPRLILEKTDEKWTITKKRKCWNKLVSLRENIKNYLTPIVVIVQCDLADSNEFYENLVPVLVNNTFISKKYSLMMQSVCGSNDSCVPDLKLTAKPNTDRYLLGSNKQLHIDIKVENVGDVSIQTTFLMPLPKGVEFVNARRFKDSQNDIPVHCSMQNNNDNFTLKCDIGKTLPSNKVVHFKILLMPNYVEGMDTIFEFQMLVTSSNQEGIKTSFDNSKRFKVAIFAKSQLTLDGNASPKQIDVTDKQKTSFAITYNYIIHNNGPLTINEIDVYILWPYQFAEGNFVNHLPDEIGLFGVIKCDIDNYNVSQLDGEKTIMELDNTSVTTTLNRNDLDKELDNVMKCNIAKCSIFKCKVGPLKQKLSAKIILSAKTNAVTLNKLYNGGRKSFNLTSTIVARLSEPLYIGIPEEQPLQKHDVVVVVTMEFKQWIWIYVFISLSVIIIIALFIALLIELYKCGFFNRNRVEYMNGGEAPGEPCNQIQDAPAIELLEL